MAEPAGGDELHHTVASRLAQHGQRYTPNRRAVVTGLAAAGCPVTLPDLLARQASLAQSSAYRCLSGLVEMGIVRRLVHAGDHAHFELAEDLTEHHHHLICEDCGAVADVTLPDVVERALHEGLDAVATTRGFSPGHHVVDLYGTCATCAPR